MNPKCIICDVDLVEGETLRRDLCQQSIDEHERSHSDEDYDIVRAGDPEWEDHYDNNSGEWDSDETVYPDDDYDDWQDPYEASLP